MKTVPTRIPDVVEVRINRRGDDRGYFSEVFRENFFQGEIANVSFVQENESLSRKVGVVRGLHYQKEGAEQGKLVRCVAGAIFDVAVDIRSGSPTFGQWVAVELSAALGNQLWVPVGFLHGFCTLEPDTMVCYKVTNYYSADHDAGVAWDDRDIGVEWPDVADINLMSPKDRSQPALAELSPAFAFASA